MRFYFPSFFFSTSFPGLSVALFIVYAWPHCPLIPLVTSDIHLQNSWIKLGVQSRAMDENGAEAHTEIQPPMIASLKWGTPELS